MNESMYHLSTPVGIHRVMKEPYDDREVFESIDDLWDYCKNGARYNGQKVACIIGTPGEGKGYVQNFTICQDFPLVDIPNGETIIDKDKGILIYNYNPFGLNSSDKVMYDSDKSHYNYLSNPFKFSMISLLKIFKGTSPEWYTFTIDEYNYTTRSSTTIIFSMPAIDIENIIYGDGTLATREFATIDNDSIPIAHVDFIKDMTSCVFHIKYGPVDESPTNQYYIIPKDNTIASKCVRMYVKANDYIKAMGEG